MSEVNRTRTVIISGFLLVLVLTLLVIRGYNQKQKAFALLEIRNNMIVMQNKEIAENRDEIAQQSLPNYRLINTPNVFKQQYFLLKVLLHVYYRRHLVFLDQDIEAEDFFWVQKSGDRVLWASVDCT